MKPINAPTDSARSAAASGCCNAVCGVIFYFFVLRWSVLSPRERPFGGRTVSGVSAWCAQVRRADWGPQSKGARRVTPGLPPPWGVPWLRAATVPLCISCVRSSSVGALTSPQQTIHDTFPLSLVSFFACRCGRGAAGRQAPLVVRGPKVTRRAPCTKLGSEKSYPLMRFVRYS